MKEKILITGASGFVGYHLIVEALKNNLDVHAAVRRTSQVDHLKSLDIHLEIFDFLNPTQIDAQFQARQYNYVLHAAGQTLARCLDDYLAANCQPTLNLAHSAVKFGVKKFLFISSLAALGPLTLKASEPLTETSVPHPITGYGISKLKAERSLKELKPLPYLILRPTAVYGPREKDLLIMFRSIKKGLEPYMGKNDQRLSFIYVKDLAQLAIQALLSNKNRETYNVSDGKTYSRYELADNVKKMLRKTTLKFAVPLFAVKAIAGILEAASRKKIPVLNREKIKELMAESWECSIDKAQCDFNFQPKYSLKKGISETIAWYQQHHWL